jgi:glycosyltransferase involved in cell wall biosynthesis
MSPREFSAAHPLRVLLLAEACNPDWTSVPLVGYNVVRALAERPGLRITLATHPRNRASLEGSPLGKKVEILYPDNEYVAATLFHIAQLLRGGQGKGWTTNTAFESISYLFFEKELHRLVHRRLAHGEFDLMHRVTPVTPTVGSPLASWTKVPMILGPLNGGLPWPPEYPQLRKQENEFLVPLRKIYKLMPYYGATYRRIRACISGSQHTASEIPASFRGARYLLPENGVDPAKFILAECWNPPAGVFRFVTVGRLVPYKGLWLTLAAMRDSELLKSCELIVIGDGPDREKLLQTAHDFGLSHCVKFLGHLDQQSLSKEMRSSQCFVFPSLREFGGGVVLEAMACGLASIVVDYGGPRDLIDGSSGILLPMQQESPMIHALRQAMERVVRDPELCKAFALNALARVRSEFTWDVKAQQVEEIYRKTLL